MTDQATAATFLHQLLLFDERLKAAGHHGLSPRFEAELSRWVRSRKRTWVCRKGRRGGGSTTALLFLVAFALFGRWRVAKGDTPVIVTMSHSLAAGRDLLRRASMMLSDAGIEHEATADKIAIPSRGVEIRNYAPNLVSILGVTAILILLDELAHYRDDASGANPSREILARLLPTMATVGEDARLLLVSSPAGFDDVHAERVARGDDDEQCVSIVPSWIGNPTLSEEQCRRDAGDELTFRREYGAEPQEVRALRPFIREHIDAALARDVDRGVPCGRCIVAADPSSGSGGDSFAWIVAQWAARADERKVLVVLWVAAERGKWSNRKGAHEVVAALARDAKKFDAQLVATDQREVLAMQSLLPQHGLKVTVLPHTTDSKAEAVARLQLLLEQGQLALPQRESERLKRQLLDYQQTETRTGLKRFASRTSAPGGDDLVSCLITLALADASGLVDGGPNARTRRKDPPPRAFGSREYGPNGPNGTDRSSFVDGLEINQRTGDK
jgi:hypothetical protein